MEVFGETGATNLPVAQLPWASMGMLRDSKDCPSIQNPHEAICNNPFAADTGH